MYREREKVYLSSYIATLSQKRDGKMITVGNKKRRVMCSALI